MARTKSERTSEAAKATSARQPYGAGSLAEKSPGVWRLRVYIRDENRQVQRTFRGTKSDAKRALRAFLTEIERKQVVQSKATVGDLLDRWIEQLGANGRRP